MEMTSEERDRDQLCEKVYREITQKSKGSNDVKPKILEILEKGKSPLHYETFTSDWIFWATEKGKRKEGKDFFINIIYDDFINNEKLRQSIPILACLLEGLTDMVTISITDGKSDTEYKLLSRLFFESERNYELLIVGETGTSKQLFARAIHLMGNRNKKPFQEINCAGIPDTMLESELFGYEKGAFTGAVKQKQGLLELAGDGTIFLDELGKMPKNLQVKILKTIQDKSFRRLGGSASIPINARFIAAIQPDDLNEITPDLKYRLGYPGTTIQVPTLNERLLINPRGVIQSAWMEARQMMGLEEECPNPFNDSTVSLLSKHHYKGNFRELCSILVSGIRSAMMDKRAEILPIDISDILLANKEENFKRDESKLDSIMLKDIYDYAENEKKAILEKKVSAILKSGKDIKTALSEEGLNKKDYQNFRKKFKTMTGKGFSDML
jgi:transcriptional regulator with PAS, ATPase and Fis domain